jgi:hypothetical protein
MVSVAVSVSGSVGMSALGARGGMASSRHFVGTAVSAIPSFTVQTRVVSGRFGNGTQWSLLHHADLKSHITGAAVSVTVIITRDGLQGKTHEILMLHGARWRRLGWSQLRRRRLRGCRLKRSRLNGVGSD